MSVQIPGRLVSLELLKRARETRIIASRSFCQRFPADYAAVEVADLVGLTSCQAKRERNFASYNFRYFHFFFPLFLSFFTRKLLASLNLNFDQSFLRICKRR